MLQTALHRSRLRGSPRGQHGCSGPSALWQPVCERVRREAAEEGSAVISFTIFTLDRESAFGSLSAKSQVKISH